MVDNKSKTLDIYRKNILLMKIKNIILVLRTPIIVISIRDIFFQYMSFGKFFYLVFLPLLELLVKSWHFLCGINTELFNFIISFKDTRSSIPQNQN